MKVELTLAHPLITQQGIVRQTVTHEGVKEYAFEEDGRVFRMTLDSDAVLMVNWAHVLMAAADPYGSIVKPRKELLVPK